MIVAVLGSNGQLGSDLMRVAREFGDVETLALCRKDLDVRNLSAVTEVLGRQRFDVLVNCTSYHKTDEAEEHATEAFLTNAHAVRVMAKSCKATGARFVHLSTDYVFDGEGTRPYKETDAAIPVNVYGASKLLGEKLAAREHRDGTLIVRVASLFGVAGSSGKGGNFVETILRKGRETSEVKVVNDITMSPTSTADAAKAILALVRVQASPGVYHVVNSGAATWFDFARQIIQEAGVQAKIVPVSSEEYPTTAIRPSYTVMDNRKTSQIVGDIPHWKQSLGQYLVDKGHVRIFPSYSLSRG